MCLRGSNQEQINLDHCSWLVTIIRTAHTHIYILYNYIYIHTHRHACTNMIHNITYIYTVYIYITVPRVCMLFAACSIHRLPFVRYLQHLGGTACHLHVICIHTLHSTLQSPLHTIHIHSPLNNLLSSHPTLCTPHFSAFHSLQCSGTVTGETCTRLFK